jgi:hypothetical protein
VLAQRAKIGIVAGLPRPYRPLRDRLGARVLVGAQRELVEELAHGMVEILVRTSS